MLFQNESTYNAEFLKASQATGVPVSVIKGVAAVESAFNAKAFRDEPKIGDASYGLMQILYKTAKGMGYQGAPAGLADPAVNALYGAKYLRGLLAKHSDLSAAVASYNMGFPRRAHATTPTIVGIYGQPQPDWIYANEPYVRRVLAYIAYYQTFERPDEKKRAVILDLIKKKDLATPRAMLQNPLFPSSGEAPAPAA